MSTTYKASCYGCNGSGFELLYENNITDCKVCLGDGFIEFEEPDKEDLTCFKCFHRDSCPYVDDAYNTNGDCLAEK